MTISASTPYSPAANAVAWAWLPAEIAITPRRLCSSVSVDSLFSAPRGLKEPVRWKSSHLSRAPRVREESIGVRTRWRSTAARARTTSSRSITLAHRLEQNDRGGRCGVEAVGGSGRDRNGDPGVGGGQPVGPEPGVLRADDDRRGAGEIGVRVSRRGGHVGGDDSDRERGD